VSVSSKQLCHRDLGRVPAVTPVGYGIVRDSGGPDASTLPLGIVHAFVRDSCVDKDTIVRDLRRAPA